MNIAKREIEEGCNHGTLVLAESQTSGRGREPGRTWDSDCAKNLLFTVVIRLDHPSQRLASAAPLAICKALRKEEVNCWIKWPNDVWINDKKVSGLLIDSVSVRQETLYSLGIGINVNQCFSPHFEIPNSTTNSKRCSVRDISHRIHSREFILANVLNELERLLSLSHSDILDEYAIYDGLFNQSVVVMPLKAENPARWEGVAKGFNRNGLLLVENDQTKETVTLSNEEVSIRPKEIKDQYKTEVNVKDVPRLLTGTWKNQLNSTMKLVAHHDGSLSGTYLTIVGNAPRENPVHGSWVKGANGPVVSFTVAWNANMPLIPFKSSTAWSGLVHEQPKPYIVTTWLLTSETDSIGAWDSTLTNKDTFYKESDPSQVSNL